MSGPVCVDASLFLSIVLDDPHQATASRLWEGWLSAGTQLVAPPLFYAEITSVIRLSNHRGDLSPLAAHEILSAGLSSPIEIWPDSRALQPRALDLAARFGHPRAYDAQYLAVAELLGCELWTVDRRLVNSVSSHLPWVHYVGEAA